MRWASVAVAPRAAVLARRRAARSSAIVEPCPRATRFTSAAARIRAVLEGQCPRNPRAASAPPARSLARAAVGRAVRSVDAHGERLFLRFDGGLTLQLAPAHDGRVGRPPRGRALASRAPPCMVVLRHGGWEVVQFDGPLLELQSDARTRAGRRLPALGPDVLGADFDTPLFWRGCARRTAGRPIGEALLNQRTLPASATSGSASRASPSAIDPWRAIGKLSDAEALALIELRARAHAGSAREGWSARPRAVYGRAGLLCPRRGTEIRKRGQREDEPHDLLVPGLSALSGGSTAARAAPGGAPARRGCGPGGSPAGRGCARRSGRARCRAATA